MSSLVGGTGIIGQDMVCGFGNGKYKTFEGTEIAVENCVKAKVKDLVVEGKTYQNLLKQANEYNFSTDVTVSNNIIEYVGSNPIVINSDLIKSDTVYTLYFNVLTLPTETINYPIRINSKGNKYDFNLGRGGMALGVNKIVFNSGSDISKLNISLYLTNYHIGFKCTMPILLEGDYTNIDLPNSINGIESVTERENNVLSVKINDNITTLNLPIPLRSLPNNVCDTIEGNKLVQRVGKVVCNGSEDWKLSSVNSNENRLLNIYCTILDVVAKNQINQSLICDKYVRQEVGIAYTTTEGVLINIEKRLYLRLFTSKATTVKKAKEYIKGNPFVVYYELATPIIHNLEIPGISTTKGINVITTSNNIKPKLKLKVKVKK